MAISPGTVLLVWPCQGSSQETQLFCECVQDTFLFQHVSESDKDKAILDLVVSTEPDLVSHIQTPNTLGDSDHSMHMKEMSKYISRAVFDYNKADVDSIKQELRTIDWNLKFQGNTLDCWSTLKSVLLDLELAHVPTRLINSNNKYRNRCG